MLSTIYKKIFVSAKNFAPLRSIWLNIFYFRHVQMRLFVGKRTTILNTGGTFDLIGPCYIDCRHAGQFSHHSTIVIKRHAVLSIDKNVNIYSGAQIICFEGAALTVGNDTYFSGPVTLHAKQKIDIGSNCAVAWGTTIIDSNFHSVGGEPVKTDAVFIGDGVWIGCNVTILPGSYIPAGSIIGAGSIVRGKLGKRGVYGGNPLRLIKVLSDED